MDDQDKPSEEATIHLLEQPPDPILGSIEQLRRSMPYLIESFVVMAKLQKAKYDELIKAGFTEKQALELCKTIM